MHPLLRFTLDLFEPDPVPVSGRKAPKARPKPKPATPAQDLVVVAGVAVHFCHPHASREVRLGHALVAYEFKRGRRRSIGFSVGPHGLAVRAPKWVPLAEVDAALQEKSAWILRKLQESRERHARLAEHTID